MGSWPMNVSKTLVPGWEHGTFSYFELSTISSNKGVQQTIGDCKIGIYLEGQ